MESNKVADNDFVMNAGKELIAIRENVAKNAMIIMAFNSPFALFGGAAAILLLVAFGKLSRAALYRDTEKFVENVDDPCLRFAN